MLKFSKGTKIFFIIYTVVMLLILPSLISITKVEGESMLPTLKTGQFLIVDKIASKDIKRNDIVIATSLLSFNHQVVKRVIGLPGDKFQIKDKKVYINEVCLDEPNIIWTKESESDLVLQETITIPKDHYFIMGDNRDNSYDSRRGGVVSMENILGKVLFVK